MEYIEIYPSTAYTRRWVQELKFIRVLLAPGIKSSIIIHDHFFIHRWKSCNGFTFLNELGIFLELSLIHI